MRVRSWCRAPLSRLILLFRCFGSAACNRTALARSQSLEKQRGIDCFVETEEVLWIPSRAHGESGLVGWWTCS